MASQTDKAVSTSTARASTPKALVTPPSLPTIVLDLGSTSRKKIRQLKKKGAGPLLKEVQAAIEETRQGLAGAEEGATIVPVVLLYRKKARKKKVAFPPLLFG